MSETYNRKKILIFRIGHLGDTLVSLPAFWAIKNAFPDAHLTLLTNVNAKSANYVVANSVLPEKGLIDDWLYYPTELSKIGTALGFAKLWNEIRREKFDDLFYLMTRNRTPSQISRDERFFRSAGVKNIFGTDFLRQNIIEKMPIRPLAPVESEAEFLLKSVAASGIAVNFNVKPDLLLSAAEKSFAENWLKENCGTAFTEKKLVAVAPGSKWESKIWAEENYALVVSALIEKHGIFPVIFGGQEDRETGNRLLQKFGFGANAAGELNIRQAAAALANCRLYLGNDTGTMHLAAAVETPCVAVFAAIDRAGRWHPFGKNHAVFRETVECEGCYLPICPFQNKCLALIEPKRVWAACEAILRNV